MIDSYLEDMEDIRDAEVVLQRIARGQEGTISLDELERRLDLSG
jgi:predicted DNA-binding protein